MDALPPTRKGHGKIKGKGNKPPSRRGRNNHMTGPKAGKKVRRKGKGLTRKQRRLKRRTHVNKYAGFGENS